MLPEPKVGLGESLLGPVDGMLPSVYECALGNAVNVDWWPSYRGVRKGNCNLSVATSLNAGIPVICTRCLGKVGKSIDSVISYNNNEFYTNAIY